MFPGRRSTAFASSCRRSNFAASWLFPLLLALSGLASAQTTDLASFQDSVARIDDVDVLREMLAQRAGRNAQQSPVALTERGFIAMRLWGLTTQSSHALLAQSSFKEALRKQPNFGWAHYGLGLAYADGPDAHPEKAGWRGAFVLDDAFEKLTGNDARSRAHREFLRALHGQPPISQAAAELAANAVAKNSRKSMEETRAALAQQVANHATPADWLALARVDAELGNLEKAADAMEAALAGGAGGASTARQRAALLLRIPGREAAGAQAWFEGIEHLSAGTSDEYYQDIEPLLSKTERENWQSMTVPARAQFLREFWDVRAALGGVSVTERLADHYRRLAVARRAYYRGPRFGAPVSNELRMLPFSQRSWFDDRGLIYIRHGDPKARIGRRSYVDNSMSAQVGEQMLTYESWIYYGLDGPPRSFHFEGSGDDYHLMHKLPCNSEWLNERVAFEPRFGPLSMRCGNDLLAASADMRAVAFEALATDSDRPNFTKELPFFFDLYTFRAEEGRTAVVAAVAVPREKLNLSAVASNPAYRIDLSLILVDTISRKVVRQDDSVALATQRGPGNDDLFRLHVEVAVPPSKSTVQRVIVSDPSEPGIGQLYGGPFPIPDYSGKKLMLSDVVLAEPSVPGRWRRGDVSLALVPTGYFRGGSFNVFYEIYNIERDAQYSTEIEIQPVRKTRGEKLKGLFGGGPGAITLRFSGVATNAKNGVLQELRRVDAPLGKGRYRMRITVKNLETGEVSRNERTFSIPD